MTSEVKIVYANVEAQLNEMKQATQSLNCKMPPPISENTLEVVTKLTELTMNLEQLLSRYQTILMKNLATTKSSVDFMRESDEEISAVMNSTVQNTKRLLQ